MRRIRTAINGRESYSGKAYFFKGTDYVRYDWGQDRVDYGPAALALWSLPAPFDQGFDAALNGEGMYDGRAFLFRGNEYLRYDWRLEQTDGGARSLDVWALPGDFGEGIDAALSGDPEYATEAYLFKGDTYVVVDWVNDVVTGPFPLSDWNLPAAFATGFDAALNGQGRFTGKAYFFKGDEYIRYDWFTQEVDVPPTPIVPAWPGLELLPVDPSTVTIRIKFQDGLPLPWVDDLETLLEPLLGGAWAPIAAAFPALTLRRTFTSLTAEELQALMDDAAAISGQPSPNLFSFYAAEYPPDQADAAAAALAALPLVDHAYVEEPILPQSVNPADDHLFFVQKHLLPAPEGIGAEYAWDFPGGDGSGVQFINVEVAWDLQNADLLRVKLLSGVNGPFATSGDVDHGTAGVAIVAGADNDALGIGIAPNVESFVISRYNSGKPTEKGDIIAAIAKAGTFKGGQPLVVLIMTGGQGTTLENNQQAAATLQTLVNRNITVVIAAGNEKQALAAGTPDSGAIMVGAGSWKLTGVGTTREWVRWERAHIDPTNTSHGSNFGPRVNCFAHGEDINTSSASYRTALRPFNATSGASAIIAGVAASVHGLSLANKGTQLSPKALRALLTDPATSVQSTNGAVVDQVGVMPDLRRIARSMGLVRPVRAGIARQRANRLHLVAIDDHDHFADRSWDAVLPNWSSASAASKERFSARRPAIVSRSDVEGDAFMVSQTGKLYWSEWNSPGPWSAPAEIAKAPPGAKPILAATASLAALSRPDHLDVFAIGNDGQIHTTWWKHPPSPLGWFPLAPISNGVPFSIESGLAALRVNDVMMVFGIRADGFLAFGAYPSTPGGNAWHNSFKAIGTVKMSRRSTLAAVAVNNLVYVFAIGEQGELFMTHAIPNTAPGSMIWAAPMDIKGTAPQMSLDGGLAAVARNQDTVDVFAIATDNRLYTAQWTRAKPLGQFDDPHILGGLLGGPQRLAARGGISAVVRDQNDVHVVVCNDSGQLLASHWQPVGGWSLFSTLF